MVYLSTNQLQQGMVNGRHVTIGKSNLALLVPGQQLTILHIQRLVEKNIAGIYVQTRFLSNIKSESFISHQVKKEMTSQIENIYSDLMQSKTISKKLGRKIQRLADNLIDLITSKEECLLNVIEIKSYDNYTYSHSLNVGVLSVLIGKELCYSSAKLSELAIAGFLHDIGKLDVPINIINKEDVLTSEELELVRKHPAYALSRLKYSSEIVHSILSGIASHHEKYDGTGYPNGLIGEEISIYARILAVADVYDAITSSRSYRRAWHPHEAIEYMMSEAGLHFDLDILQAFLKIVSAYPIGSVVELSNSYIGVVIQNSANFTLRPTVRIILPEEKCGEEYDLATNMSFLSVTITGAVTEFDKFPKEFFT